jgi:hypothetical protein
VLEEDDVVEILLLVGCTTVVLFFDLHMELRVCESFNNVMGSWKEQSKSSMLVYSSFACFKFK